MKPLSYDITKIKDLLDRFYSGTSTPDEEARLRVFFSKTDPGELPGDLREDAGMFRAMTELHDEACSFVPDDLEDKILAIVDGGDTNRTRRRIIRYASWISAAAAVALVLLTVLPLRHGDTAVDRPAPLVAVNDPESTGEILEEAVHDEDSSALQPLMIPAGKVAGNIATTGGMQAEADPYREIDDPEEAARLTAEALSLIRSKMAVANKSVKTYETKINNIRTTIKSVLGDEKI